ADTDTAACAVAAGSSASATRRNAVRTGPYSVGRMADGNGNAPGELFLIDGNSLAYRAFFALPESIATSTGFPTNAIFGFASMLVKILTDNGVKPTGVVWDAGSSGRKEIHDEYKRHRPRQPDLPGQQCPHIPPLVPG